MLTQYTNKDTFNKSGADYASRFELSADKLIIKNVNIVNYTVPSVEMHIYSADKWVTGDHTVIVDHSIPDLVSSETGLPYKFNGNIISYNLKNTLNKLNLTAGNFRFVVNFFKDLIGSYNQQFLYIDEISPDRTELKLRVTNDINGNGVKQFVDYAFKFTIAPSTDTKEFPIYNQYLLNFSQNQTVAYVNSVVIDDTIYIKLLDQLPDDIEVNFKCWIVEELKQPYTDLVSLIPETFVKTFNTLAPPNLQVNVGNLNISSETDVKNWNDLLGSSVQTSQQIVDKYFSGSLSGIPLNIDYRDFNNFIFYSSAEERLRNFKYKLELIEYYNSQISVISGINGSTATTNMNDYVTNKTNLISGFDSFEKYLYNESSSLLYNNDNPVINPNVASITGSYIFPVPKTNSTVPYSLYATTSSIFNNWYDNLIESASLYDSLNINKLSNFLPPGIHYNENNDQLIIFVNMLGHHYDILHSYIKQASAIYKHEENPKLGIPNDLLFNVAKQFGWELADGNQYQELWGYVLGTDEAGTPLTGSNSVGDPSVSGLNMTRTVWRRIVNNLPLLLKSKGTKRSVQALLSCYGIPQSMININEYGGPSINKVPVYEKLNFDYSLDLINNAAGSVNIEYSKPIGAVELRFRTDDVVSNPTMPSNMNLITISGSQINVKLNFTSGNKGTATIYDNNSNTATTNEIELFDGSWLSMLINKNGSNLDLYINKAKYGKIVATVSASITSTMPINGSVKLGVPATGASRLKGQLQELRLWTGSLSLNAFNNHTKAPSSYNGTIDAYDELVFRLPLTQKINHATTSSLTGVQPVPSTISASFSSWTNNEPYDSIEETYYFDSLSIAMSTHEDNKIRIESSELDSSELQLLKRIERSEYDAAPLDSNKLGIFFSPQSMINDDIIAQLGYTELDSYIGDPGKYEQDEYPDLARKAREYWKKYKNKNNFNEYIRVFTLFDLSFFKQLEQLLPARVDKMTGLLIQPNLLERNKQSILPTVQRLYQELEFGLSGSATVLTADSILITSSILISEGLINSNLIDNNNGFISIIHNNFILSDINSDLNFYITGSNDSRYMGSDYSMHDGFISPLTSSVLSKTLTKIETFFSGGVKYKTTSSATVTGYQPAGWLNSKYNGCKMTSAGFNIGSPDTYLGKPVVEIIIVNPNSININPSTPIIPNVDNGKNPFFNNNSIG